MRMLAAAFLSAVLRPSPRKIPTRRQHKNRSRLFPNHQTRYWPRPKAVRFTQSGCSNAPLYPMLLAPTSMTTNALRIPEANPSPALSLSANLISATSVA
jgi:hypothetical protein